MAFHHKYSYEEKERILIEYLNGTYGFRELCRIYEMRKSMSRAAKCIDNGPMERNCHQTKLMAENV